MQRFNIGEITVVCPDLHDLAVAKSVAGRGKDADWVRSLLRHKMIELPRLEERIESLAPSGVETGPLLVWARRRAAEAA